MNYKHFSFILLGQNKGLLYPVAVGVGWEVGVGRSDWMKEPDFDERFSYQDFPVMLALHCR